MRWQPSFSGGLLIWAASWCAAHGESPELPEPIVTTSYDFKLPFAIDPREQPVNMQLYVSTDRGQSWNLAQVVAPGAGKFAFQAPFAGEYWFAVRSADAAGRRQGIEKLSPEVRVLVAMPAAVSPAPPSAADSLAQFTRFETPPTAARQGDLQPRMVNSRTLDIDYEVPAGPDAPREIAVWLTRDGGQHWQRHATDPDCRSPARITVDRDGLYGLWIVMTDATGTHANEPRNGESPGVWIGVDTTAPEAHLIRAESDAVHGEREMTVRWEASDARLSVAPVNLSYRCTPQEPWLPLASNLLNTGSQRVKLDRSIPEWVQLRLDVRDEAGNLTSVETRERVSTVARASSTYSPGEQATLQGTRTYQILR